VVRDILVCCELAVTPADFVLSISHISLNYPSEIASIGAWARKIKGFCVLLGTEGHHLYGSKDLEFHAL